ncbi:MAG TPA: amidohydrolase family protein [Terriglobia bacterium]|nr:amidohydrolase family protein [Terriglobia bacterium]
MTRTSVFLVSVALATLTLVTPFAFQPSLAQAPTGSGVIAITGARIIDGTGRAPLPQGTIIVNKGVIEAVGPAATVKIPPGATRVDLSGKTIVPGLINAHAHLNVWQGAKMSVRDDLIRRLKTYAMYGVTSAVSLGSRPADELEGIKLRDEQTRVTLDRARLYTGGLNAIGKTPDEARKSVDRLADLKVDVIKYHINGNPNDMTPDIYGALVDEAKKKGLRTFVHVYYLKDAKGAVEKGTDILAHSIRDQDVDAAFAAELKRRNIGYIPTLTRDLSVFVYETRPAFFDEPFFRKGIALYDEEVGPLSRPASQQEVRNDKQAQSIKQALQQANRNLKILSDAGVPIAMGTDSGAEGNPGRWQGYFEHVEMEMMAKAGMTPMQVIVAATGGAARVTKVDPKIGTIEPGKWADLLVLNANPLDDIRNTRQIHSVWVGGQRIQP